jgi:hypothetical protein
MRGGVKIALKLKEGQPAFVNHMETKWPCGRHISSPAPSGLPGGKGGIRTGLKNRLMSNTNLLHGLVTMGFDSAVTAFVWPNQVILRCACERLHWRM